MTRPYFPEKLDQLTAAIDQADWLTTESGYTSLDDLWASDPDLYTILATEWREDHPITNQEPEFAELNF